MCLDELLNNGTILFVFRLISHVKVHPKGKREYLNGRYYALHKTISVYRLKERIVPHIFTPVEFLKEFRPGAYRLVKVMICNDDIFRM